MILTPDPRVPTGPIDTVPGRFIPDVDQQRILRGVLSGIDLGSHDERIIDWLAGWETSTVLTVASLILRARAAGQDRIEQGERLGP